MAERLHTAVLKTVRTRIHVLSTLLLVCLLTCKVLAQWQLRLVEEKLNLYWWIFNVYLLRAY